MGEVRKQILYCILLIRDCLRITSATQLGGFQKPSSPLVSNGQHLPGALEDQVCINCFTYFWLSKTHPLVTSHILHELDLVE